MKSLAKSFVASALLALSLGSSPFAQARDGSFPIGPDADLTPGTLCAHPDSQRYPERIDYCERDVNTDLKRYIMEMYDSKLGFNVTHMKRELFKIDHYIPLCAGGSNEMSNLWPQHKSVYEITDPLEQMVCEKMSQGKLLQKDAVDLIRQAKNNLDDVKDIIKHVRGL